MSNDKVVADFFPEAPAVWLTLPAELNVDIALSEGACVYGQVFTYYARDSLEEALRVVCGPRQDGILIGYHLAARGVIPLLRWSIDWPLARRGREAPVKRTLVQGAAPWDFETDRTFVSLYQAFPGRGQWNPPYFGETTVRLRAAGRTAQEAVTHWHACAAVLRRLRQALDTEGKEVAA
jgi:hypothetical protein